MPHSQVDLTRAAEDIRAFIVDNFLFGSSAHLSHDDSFLERGIIDSTGILELVAFVEHQFQVRVDDRELVPENLDSISRLVAFVERKHARELCA
jgi:acyl carrier protein